MNDCVFCRIISGELLGSFVFKNALVSVFMDLHPVNTGHVLIVPNTHFSRFTMISPNIVEEMFKVAQNILKSIEDSDIICEGANLFLSDGEVAGQEVPHSHLHITPRFQNDGHKMGFSHFDSKLSNRELLDSTAEKIKQYFKG